MKLNKWLYGAAALAMLAACSESDIAPDSGKDDQGGEGYVGVRIQLPAVPTTRTSNNDQFDDGEPSEYFINDAIILLFQGNTAADAKCMGAFNLKAADPSADGGHSQITSRVTRVASVSGLDSDLNTYALVMINGASNLYPANMPYTSMMAGKTIKELQETPTTAALFTQATKGKGYASSIFMTNSPLSTKPGGAVSPGTISNALDVLVKLDGKLYSTESEALANPAGVIHVERAVGKVTCSKFNKDTDVTVKIDGTEYKLTVKDIWWDMAQDLANTYVVRNTNRYDITANTNSEDSKLWAWNLASDNIKADAIVGKYRMIGGTPLTEVDLLYRPYFCQVPGYGDAENETTVYESKTFTKEEMIFDPNTAVAWNADNAFYPRENTFPVEYMRYANTTRIGFWVTYTLTPTEEGNNATLDISGKNFYISGVDKSTLYLDDANGNDPLSSLAVAKLSSNENVKNAVSAALNKDQAGSFNMDNLAHLLKFTTGVGNDGELRITNVAFKSLAEIDKEYEDVLKNAPSYDFSSLITSLNNLGNFYRYSGGRAFYELRIKHFGDDLTPWNEDGSVDVASTIAESYGADPAERKANYLGRYGVVRNNWYDLNITNIKRLGYPEDPARWDESWPAKPDDNKDQYISVELRVLSWAKRTQEHEF
ncbi:MAG: Mfa1 fimbrilin C-terminal domain-containing protein [Muribaculaceae bacterium]|nr:Mfa1 fimbrilin C-terminal domain-containing protein [Muribaculaceae bacterium]